MLEHIAALRMGDFGGHSSGTYANLNVWKIEWIRDIKHAFKASVI
jgi:hypothetical protein